MLWVAYRVDSQGLLLVRGSDFPLRDIAPGPSAGPPAQWTRCMKQPEHEFDHSPSSSAEVKNAFSRA